MFTMKFDEHLGKYKSMLVGAGRQAPFALSVAMNDLAFMIRTKEMDTITQVFNNPKPQTVRNIRVRKATKDNLTAHISFHNIWDGDEYIIPEIEGGTRTMKRSEKLFGRYFVPGAGAKLDKYGSMLGSQITQIISQLKLFSERGYKMNETGNSRARRTGAKKSTEYFMITQTTGGLIPGVYQRIQSGTGFGGKTSKSLPVGSFQKGRSSGKYASVIRSRGVIPVIIFVNKPPAYNKRFPFYEVGQQVIADNGHQVLAKAIDRAMSTAR
jgi:hypothetical protein